MTPARGTRRGGGDIGQHLEGLGTQILRYGLVLVVLWIGLFKFTAIEAQGIQPLVAHSPFLSWLYSVTNVRGASRLIGSAEIGIALLIAIRPWSVVLSAIGSLGAIGMFLTTLSFLVTTPGTFAWVGGFVFPSEVGAFLIKDFLLLGAAVSTAGEALGAAIPRSETVTAPTNRSQSRT